LFGGNGGLLGFTIGNPKYLEGPKGHGGFGGLDLLPFGSDGCPTKILSTSLGITITITIEPHCHKI
jgi:hypothetical protein